MAPIRKEFPDTEVRAVRDRVRRFVISTGAVDRDNDTIDPHGWQLDNYRKNPVVLWAHAYAQLPLAKALDVRVEGTRLVADAEFADHDFANTVLRLIDGGFLRATSVGFRPHKSVRNEQRGGVDYIEQELLEFSVVPVPANAAAVRHLKAAGLLDDVVLELADSPTESGDLVLEIAEDNAADAWRRDLRERVYAAAVAGLRARGYAAGDPLSDPSARHRGELIDVDERQVQTLVAETLREVIGGVARDAAVSTIRRLMGRVD
ncbi:MAG: HK97 family phage prohead protease [Vicinamibacterales bacterium]